MTTDSVQIRNLPGIPLAVVRRHVSRAELPKVVPECCGLVWNAVKAQQARGGRHVAIYWDGGIRLEVGVELESAFVEQNSVVRSATPNGIAAFATHLGPYQTLGATHKAIRDWCTASGHRLAGPNWEIYGHWESAWNANPALIRTDVFYQIAES
jgi:effector-binding domain-containing protein